MNANLPKYMTIKDICAYTGYSRYQFMRLADRARIPTQRGRDGRSRVIDVQQAIAAIEALPDEYREVPVNFCDRTLRSTCKKEHRKQNKKTGGLGPPAKEFLVMTTMMTAAYQPKKGALMC